MLTYAGTPAPAAPTRIELGAGALLPKADERSIRLTDPRLLEQARMPTYADVCCTEQAAGRAAVGSVRRCELNMSLSYDIARFFPAPSAAPSGTPLNSLY